MVNIKNYDIIKYLNKLESNLSIKLKLKWFIIGFVIVEVLKNIFSIIK
jgi:hypothetical protein